MAMVAVGMIRVMIVTVMSGWGGNYMKKIFLVEMDMLLHPHHHLLCSLACCLVNQ